jgi:hypothetical protein
VPGALVRVQPGRLDGLRRWIGEQQALPDAGCRPPEHQGEYGGRHQPADQETRRRQTQAQAPPGRDLLPGLRNPHAGGLELLYAGRTGDAEQAPPYELRIGGPVVRLLRQQVQDQRFQVGWDVRAQRRRWVGFFAYVSEHDRGQRALERRPAAGELVEHTSQRVQVAALVHRLAGRELGCDVGDRAHRGVVGGEPFAGLVQQPGQPEVDELELFICCQDEIGRLEVAVHDAGLVCRGQRRRRLRAELADLRERQRAAVLQHLGQRTPGEVLHHEERTTVPVSDVVRGDDVGVGEPGGSPGFTEKPFPIGRIAEILVQQLDRDETIEYFVFGAPNLAHPATAHQLLQPITVDPPFRHSAYSTTIHSDEATPSCQ